MDANQMPQQTLDDGQAQRRLSESLLQRLGQSLHDQVPPRGASGIHRFGRCLFRYGCFKAERIAQVQTQVPLIGIILKGAKELWLGENSQRLEAGSVFVLPAGPRFDVINIPDPRHGFYESLLVEVPHVPRELLVRKNREPSVPGKIDFRIRLSPALVAALAHAATALQGTDDTATLAGYRLAEVLTLLREQAAASPLFSLSLGERIALLVIEAPTRKWTADEIGQELGLGASTLRRKLSEQGTSLRKIQVETRMRIAHQILENGEGSVLEAASAAGYASRSHFVRRFRSIYQGLPSEFRRPDRSISRL